MQPASGSERLARRYVYGEAHPQATALNLRGRPYQVYDGAGVVTSLAHDFKGNLLQASRRLRSDVHADADWSVLAALTDGAAIAAAAEPWLETESFATQTAYDALNRPTSVTAPDTSELRPTYNEAGLLERVEARVRGAAAWTTFVDDIDYDAKGQRERIDYGNGTSTAYTYDPLTFRLSRLRTQRSADSAVLQNLTYVYDPAGNIVEIGDSAQQTVFFNNAVVSPSAHYVYDAVYRLTEATGREHASLAEVQRDQNDMPIQSLPHANNAQALRNYTEQYVYDAVGNLLRMVHQAGAGGWTRRYAYEATSNRLTSTSLPDDPVSGPYSATYAHDEHGNMTAMPHIDELTWDENDQLRSTDLGGGGVVHYTYDAAGQRVRKVWEHSGLVEERIYLGGYEVYRRRNATGLVLERQTLHVMDGARRVAMVETKTIDTSGPFTVTPRLRYQLDNHLGSVSLEVDAAGLVIGYEEYHPYGTTAYWSASSAAEVSRKRYRYTGKEKDEETGLYYHGARYYAPWLGRWTAADPIGLQAGVNLYAYVSGNPIRLHDPTGTLDDEPDYGLEFLQRLTPVVAVHQGVKPPTAEEQQAQREAVKQERRAQRTTPSTESPQPRREDLRDSAPILPFFFRVPGQFIRTNQSPPENAPVGLSALRSLNAGASLAVANFSRDIAPGTAVENLTALTVDALGGAVSVLSSLHALEPVLRAQPVVTQGIRGTASVNRPIQYAKNAGGPRTYDEALEIAKKAGIEIPEDISVRVAGELVPKNADAAYYVRSAGGIKPGETFTWESLMNKRTEQVVIKLRPEVLESDEAIIGVLTHELYELNKLREIFDEAPAGISASRFARLVNEDIPGNLHDQAVAAANAAVAAFRQRSK
ncbi:RHS repeat domain-containing protein [Sorangium sp. So ce1128]